MLCVYLKKLQSFTSTISYTFLRLKISLLNTIEVTGRWLMDMMYLRIMYLHKVKISKLSDWAEIENVKSPDPPVFKNGQFINFDP